MLQENETQEPKKPGRKPKTDPMTERVEKLELCVAKMAHYSGQERVLDEFGIERWTPGRNDMRKYKD